MNKLVQWISHHPWQFGIGIILLYFSLQILGAIGVRLLQPPAPESESLQNLRVPSLSFLV